ncbi:hypothetical protein [Haladaptatus sp. NG-SE-30]
MTGRSTDYAIEERQLQQREGKEGVEKWIENVFFALGEVTFLALPAFAALMDAVPNAPTKFVALFAWVSLTLTTGTLRGERFATEWPSLTPLSLIARLAYYNAVVLLVTEAGVQADLAFHSPVVTAGVAVVLSVVAGVAFPRLTSRVTDGVGRASSDPN